MYYTFFEFCIDGIDGRENKESLNNSDKEKDTRLKIIGKLLYKNPYGYLNAEMYQFFHYLFYLVIFNILILFLCIFFLYKYRHYIITIHFTLTYVLLLSTLQFLLQYTLFQNLNANGEQNINLFLLDLFQILNVITNTSSRVLTLLLSFKYRISRPSVPKYPVCKISILTIFYISANLFQEDSIYQLLRLYHYKSFLPELFNTVFICWIYQALRATRKYLDSKNQHIK